VYCGSKNNWSILTDGGEWEWKEFGKAVAEGALGGAIDGAIGGTVTLPGIGTVAGAAGMGAVGAVIGAVVDGAVGWW